MERLFRIDNINVNAPRYGYPKRYNQTRPTWRGYDKPHLQDRPGRQHPPKGIERVWLRPPTRINPWRPPTCMPSLGFLSQWPLLPYKRGLVVSCPWQGPMLPCGFRDPLGGGLEPHHRGLWTPRGHFLHLMVPFSPKDPPRPRISLGCLWTHKVDSFVQSLHQPPSRAQGSPHPGSDMHWPIGLLARHVF